MRGMDYEYAPDIIKDGKPHLVFYLENGAGVPAVQETKEHGGSPLWYVEDPTLAGAIYPMYIKSLSKKEWVLRCACGKPGCTLEFVHKIRLKGRHPLPDAVVEPE